MSGRLKHANIPVQQKCPYIIPHESAISHMIAKHHHQKAHNSTEWTLGDIRMKYCLIRGRTIVKRVIRECITCRRLYASSTTQMMSDLPPERVVNDQPAFTVVGLDCFGPYMVKYRRSEVPRYGCIFTCFSTRAIHIEVLETMEADSFINCLRRFISRRGTPSSIYSDNGTNFVGAYNTLERAHQERIASFAVSHEIQWKFHPPKASHFGGVWERMIRTIRKVFNGILPSARLTDEILVTTLCEVESIINGRPLTKVSEDPNDDVALTPNHLLLLKSNHNMPVGNPRPNDVFRGRWRHVQHIANQFWIRWSKEYLPTLHKRTKWLLAKRNICIGDLVLMCDENTPRALWPLGLVVATNEGRDGLVRSVRLKTKAKEMVRPVTKLVFLEAFGEDVV